MQSLAFSMLEAALFPKKLAINFRIFNLFLFHFKFDPGPNPLPEPELECITVPVSLKQKVAVPSVSVPQH